MISLRRPLVILSPLILWSAGLVAQSDAAHILNPKDIFELEWAADPQISPSGTAIVYVRSFFDIMTDRALQSLAYERIGDRTSTADHRQGQLWVSTVVPRR